VTVAPGWGRTTLLHRFQRSAKDPNGPAGIVAWIDGHQPSLPSQVLEIREALTAAVGRRPGLAGLLDLDRAIGRIQLGLGLAGLFTSGTTAVASLLVATMAVTAAGNAWDASPVGEQGTAARAARKVARISVQVAAAVIIDDADQFDPHLALTLVRGLAERPDAQVLVIAAAAPDSALARMLVKEPGPTLAGRVYRAAVNPGMGYADRVPR